MFPAYFQVAPNRYQERFGLAFEDFAVGQRFRHRPGVTITQQDNLDEALDTLNSAMVHYDAHYAAQTQFKQPLMVSTVTLQRVIGMASKTFGKKRRLLGFKELAMTAPIFGGDTLYAESEILEVHAGTDPDCGVLVVATHGLKPDRTAFARLVYRIEIYRRGRHPEELVRAAPIAAAVGPRFASHRDDAGVWVEQAGFFFEDAMAGESFVHFPRRSFFRDEAIEHSFRSMDLSPQFHDLAWIDAHQGGRYRVPETFVITAVTALTTRTFGRVMANLGWTDIELADVHAGDTIQAESAIIDKRESKSRPNEGILTVDTRAFNQHGDKVCSYRRNLLVYRRDAVTPYGAAGY